MTFKFSDNDNYNSRLLDECLKISFVLFLGNSLLKEFSLFCSVGEIYE